MIVTQFQVTSPEESLENLFNENPLTLFWKLFLDLRRYMVP
jgi:hypothetical protein